MILLRAEGPAFCAGYGLDWSTAAQAARRSARSASWDSVADMRMIGRFVDAYMKLWYASKPTIAAVQGWCIAGGTDMVLCADMIMAGETRVVRLSAGARVGHADHRDVGVPARARAGQALPAHRRRDPARRRPPRSGSSSRWCPTTSCRTERWRSPSGWRKLPLNQLADAQAAVQPDGRADGPRHVSRLIGTLFDGVARHTQEGLDFVERSQEVGFRQAVRERDDPFGDYGSRPKPTQ